MDVVTELAKGRAKLRARCFRSLGSHSDTLFDESNSLMQDLPNYAAEPMGDGPNGRLIAQPRQQTPATPLGSNCLSSSPQRGLPGLWFSSALSSFPGQVPTQEVNCAAEGNVLVRTPALRFGAQRLFFLFSYSSALFCAFLHLSAPTENSNPSFHAHPHSLEKTPGRGVGPPLDSELLRGAAPALPRKER